MYRIQTPSTHTALSTDVTDDSKYMGRPSQASSSNDSISSMDSTFSLTSLSSTSSAVSLSSTALSSSSSSIRDSGEKNANRVHDVMMTCEGWAVQCNNAGIDCFNDGQFKEATELLQRGLRVVQEMYCVHPLIGNTATAPFFDIGDITDPAVVQVVESTASISTGRNAPATTRKGDDKVNRTSSEQNTNMYIYQREEYDEGLDYFNDVLPVDESMPLSELTATILYNLGQAISALSKAAACESKERMYLLARKCYQQTWAVLLHPDLSPCQIARKQSTTRSKVCHRKKICVAATLHNLARLEYKRGHIFEAVKYAHHALDHVRLHYNEQNAESLVEASVVLNTVGVLTFHLPTQHDKDDCAGKKCNGKGEDATKLRRDENMRRAMLYYTESLKCRQAVAGAISSVGDDHSAAIATILNNMGRVHYLLGDNNAALVTYHAALDIRRRVLGSNHLDVAATIYNAGQSYHQKGELATAMGLYREFLMIAKKNLGEHHRDVAIMTKCIAQVHHECGEQDSAKVHYEKALLIGRAALGPHHPEVASVLNKLGNLLYETGNMVEALRVYEEGLEVERIVFDPSHPNIVVTLTNIGQIYKIRGDRTASLNVYREALAIQRRTLGMSHPQTASALASIALLYFQSKAYSKALNVYQETLRIRRDAFGDDHLDVAATLNSVGLVLFKMEYHQMAIQSFQHCLAIRRKLLGEFHRDVAVILYNIATVHLELGDEDEAVEYYRQTLHVEKQALGDGHQDVLITMQHIASVHQQRGELEEALGYLKESLDVQFGHYQQQQQQQQHQKQKTSNESPCNDTSINLARTWNQIGNLHLQKGDTRLMMDAYVQATRVLRQVGETEIELSVSGFNLYMLSKIHPECARAA
eukprot:CAMPEP_0113507042 /NCGR_PEP_ID=MMETSP0014_2-20120614/36241_1 /TAXON_ID=2857 /ORGANISM="Nitzschia sp." /LENGTH=872 /DNA_ID=CAMNT_0000402599 /DNA_START=98 /DNA_END=2716 /DNA_ORIENTATION=- /assembly_acc=CAM_ASM_000159